MAEDAAAKGADAVLAMRFDTSEMGGNWTEICAYGTAVKVAGLPPAEAGSWQGAAEAGWQAGQ